MTAHVSVLLREAMQALAIRPEGVYVDATFGAGGHARAILERLGPSGRVVALDRDPHAIALGREIRDSRLALHERRFSEIAEALREERIAAVDGVLCDLGVSSMQLDDPRRGFSFRHDAPLDMRMGAGGESAGDWLARAGERDITRVLRDYGEERFAHAIAKAVVAARSRQPVATTRQLAAIVESAVRTREPGQHPATRTFQALRILANQELEELSLALPRMLDALRPGGRLAVISFHSLEDRIVKRFMREAASPRVPADLPLRASEMPPPLGKIVGKPLRPQAEETAANPRARSAILRVLEKTS